MALAALAGLVISRVEVRRAAALAALAGGVLILVAAAIGFAKTTGVADGQVGGVGLGVEARVEGGLYLSAVGGLVAVLGGLVAGRRPAG